MEKLVYLIHEDADKPGAELREHLLGPVAERLRRAGATRITVNVDDEDVAEGKGVLIRRSAPPLRAMASFWMDNADDRAPCEAALEEVGERLAGYLVLESVPQPNTAHPAAAGERTTGANLVTCIRRLPGQGDEAFFHHWHHDHKIVARETQSTFAYVRNTVARAITPGAPVWDGIVEESFPAEALTDPTVWYAAPGDEELYKQRLERMLASVRAFLDLSVLESTPMSEYRLGD